MRMIKIWDFSIDRYCFVAVLFAWCLDVSIWQAVSVGVNNGDNKGHYQKYSDVTYSKW